MTKISSEDMERDQLHRVVDVAERILKMGCSTALLFKELSEAFEQPLPIPSEAEVVAMCARIKGGMPGAYTTGYRDALNHALTSFGHGGPECEDGDCQYCLLLKCAQELDCRG